LEALTLFEEALVSLRKVFGPQHPNTISCIGNLGWMYKSQNKFNKALPLLTRAVDLKTKSLGLNHPDTLTSIFTLASLFMQTKEYLEAEKLSRQVLDGRLATEGGKQYVRESVDQLGMILLLQGKSRDAKAMEKSQGFKRDKNTLELEVYNGKKERCVVS
jgi:tetratricopeptide (TPR) repeat protein